MLPDILQGPGRFAFDADEWASYLARIGDYATRIDREFLRQVPYDHFSHFNNDYPWFDVDRSTFRREYLTALDVRGRIRYFDNEPLDFWYDHFDDLARRDDTSYEIFRAMRDRLTWPFPPIVMLSEAWVQGPRAYGRPLHLIEGTHRVSYLCRMLDLGLVASDSTHEIVLVSPNYSSNPY